MIIGYIIGVSTMVTGARYVAMVGPSYVVTILHSVLRTKLISAITVSIGHGICWSASICDCLRKVTQPTHVCAGLALSLVWVANAVPRPPAKRAAAIGIVSGFGNVGTL